MACKQHPKYQAKRPPRAACDICWKNYEAHTIAAASTSKGRAKGGGQSSKAKGRSAVKKLQNLILARFPHLTENDVVVRATSQAGVDLHLSEAARKVLPLAVEVKNVEALNVWAALAQAKVNAEKTRLTPVLFFKRSNTDMFAAIEATYLLELLARQV